MEKSDIFFYLIHLDVCVYMYDIINFITKFHVKNKEMKLKVERSKFKEKKKEKKTYKMRLSSVNLGLSLEYTLRHFNVLCRKKGAFFRVYVILYK